MPTDTQIPGPQTQPAPSNYRVPATVELLLKAVNANFVDNGASGDWLPAVVLLSDSGDIIARAVDQGVKVTAGADAEVSWFPGLKHASSGSGATVAWGRALQSGGPQVVTADPVNPVPVQIVFDPLFFGDDGSGTFFMGAPGNQFVQSHASPAPGVFYITVVFEHDDNAPTGLDPSLVRASIEFSTPTDINYLSEGVNGPFSDLSGDPTFPGARYGFGLSWMIPSRGFATPVGFDLAVTNFNPLTADLNVAGAEMMVSLVAA